MSSDSYQAVYDAVRSRFHGCDVGAAVESAACDAFGNASHVIACVGQEFTTAAHELQLPSAVFRPSLSIDGGQWCALYGANLQDGVAGFGDSPAKAMEDFDKAWRKSLEKTGGAA